MRLEEMFAAYMSHRMLYIRQICCSSQNSYAYDCWALLWSCRSRCRRKAG